MSGTAIFSIRALPTKTLLPVLLAACVIGVKAQEQERDDPTSTAAAASQEVTLPAAGAPAMSRAADRDEAPPVSDDLVTRTGNTVMTAGTCLVIDDLVRQFCAANPGDSSCQFQ